MSFRTFASLGLLACTAACTVTTTAPGGGSGTSTGSGSQVTTAKSETVPTNKMHPSLSAQDYGDGSGVHVYAAWLSGDGAWLLTTGGDVVSASVDDAQPTVLYVENDVPDKVHYTATFPSAAKAQTITIGLTRPSGRVSAPGSSTVIGAPFTLVTAIPKSMAQGDKLEIAIDPPPGPDTVGDGDSWQLTATGACIADFTASTVNLGGAKDSGLINASGHFVFDTSQVSQQGPSSSCDVTVMVKHLHYGQLDPSYGSSASGLSLALSDAPIKDNVPDTTYAVEGLQARAAHTTFSFP